MNELTVISHVHYDPGRAEGARKKLRAELDQLEAKYGMESSIFITAFENGDLPEKYDFFRWRVNYYGYLHYMANHYHMS